MTDLSLRPQGLAAVQRVQPFLVAACLLLLVFLAGCASTRGGEISYDVQDFGEPDLLTQTVLGEDYRISPLDKLSIQVFQVPSLSGEYEVDLTGRVSLPLIGGVRAVDLSADELSDELELRYGERHLVNPEIAVGIAESRGSVLTIEGAVRQPGVYPVLGRTTLLQSIARAGGIDQMGNAKRIAIFRQIDGQRMAAAFDLTTIRSGEDEDPLVYRGDIVVVDGNGLRQAWTDTIRSLPLFTLFTPIP